jgi:1-acyl-sn-glycerol-3-phosphate acyltransferase
MRHTWRFLDFVSITEVYENRLSAWFLSSMNTFPLDRHRPDSPTVRIILDRLKRGRAVVMFPEGRLRTPQDSVLAGGPIKPGVARIALLAQVPIIPVVVVGASAYLRVSSWAPLWRTVYGINYGKPIMPTAAEDSPEARAQLLEQVRQAYRELHRELFEEIDRRGKQLSAPAPMPQ